MKKTQSVLVDSMEYCIVCGSPYTEVHHIFFGHANRYMADKYGYVLPLCNEHHRGMKGPHRCRSIDLVYKGMAQQHFEENKGNREMFIQLFGRSFL